MILPHMLWKLPQKNKGNEVPPLLTSETDIKI